MAKTQPKGKITLRKQSSPVSQAVDSENVSDNTDSGLEDDDELDVQEDHSSDEEASAQENDSDQESGDESSGSESEQNDQEADAEDDEFPMRKKKKVADDGRQSFASAFNAIMGSKLKAYDRKDPILSRSKSVAKQLESDKLEAKARRMLHAEKAELLDKCHISELLPSADEPEKARAYLEKERNLRKTAQRGVVKLFNAVMSSQALVSEEMSQETAGPQRKSEILNEVTKSTFLDMVKAAGDE